MKLQKLIFFPVFILTGCDIFNDKDTDFRDPYTGWFEFTTIKSHVSMCFDLTPECIDNWEEHIIDTSYYTSEIILSDISDLYIEFGRDTIGILHNGSVMLQAVKPFLETNGHLDLLDFLTDEIFFDGSFAGYDTLTFELHYRPVFESYDRYYITGIRK